jgi:hypothetical protein
MAEYEKNVRKNWRSMDVTSNGKDAGIMIMLAYPTKMTGNA